MKFNYFNAGSTSKGASFKRIVRAGRLNKSRTNKNEHYAINAINSTRKFNRQRVVTTGFKHGIPLPVARCTKRKVNQENASRFLFISNSQTFPNDDDIRPAFYSGPIKKNATAAWRHFDSIAREWTFETVPMRLLRNAPIASSSQHFRSLFFWCWQKEKETVKKKERRHFVYIFFLAPEKNLLACIQLLVAFEFWSM